MLKIAEPIPFVPPPNSPVVTVSGDSRACDGVDFDQDHVPAVLSAVARAGARSLTPACLNSCMAQSGGDSAQGALRGKRVLIVGRGRMGQALFAALRRTRLDRLGVTVDGPVGRATTEQQGGDADIVLLAVPDDAIADAAARIVPGRLVGHLSGATDLSPLSPHEAFSLHPLITVTGALSRLEGASAAIAGSTARAHRTAQALTEALRMTPFSVDDEHRAAYHAAASIASNFFMTIEGFAEEVAASVGVTRAALVPLVRAAVENWSVQGAAEALTGPIARGDEETVARQREAIQSVAPERLALFDALVAATRDLAAQAGHVRADARPRVVRTVNDLREALAGRRGGSVGLVPTMGALHEGHLSLVHAARQRCDTVVMSIFVNPTQFSDAADLETYPRDEARDVALAAEAGVDIIFAPGTAEMYPEGFSTTVRIDGPITETLEAAGRGRGHFDGMATVVTKLFTACMPDLTFFGAKDAQQVVVVRRLIADLRLPIELVVCETLRDVDGLARSSRNVHLSEAEREQARGIPAALTAAETLFQLGETSGEVLIDQAKTVLVQHGIEPEYLVVVDAATLESVTRVDRPALLLTAARIGSTRLIDNVSLTPGDD